VAERIERTFIEEEMEQSYINYAMSVIRGRAIPDVRDGLKPVQRRILYGMSELGLSPGRPHRKAARIVGEVMGKLHPHGDSAIYDTMVNMAQPFSYRYPLVDGQGNFGSIDGDAAAADRYTEARMSQIAEEFLHELGEHTVDWTPNYDESMEEPVYLPARIPNLLMNGAWGISVGMTTQIPPHNLGELIDGTIALMSNPEMSSKELLQYIPGPDFPTGGVIMGRDGIEEMYRTGHGKLRMRGRAEIEDDRIVISEIPYLVRKSTIVESIADKVQKGQIDGVADLRDESDREGLRVVVELKRNATPNVVLNQIYKFTPLERTFAAAFLVIIDGNPRTLSLKEILNTFIDFRRDVVRRRTEHRLEVARRRAHILEGYRAALADIERTIALIRAAEDASAAAKALQRELALSDEQTDAILKMRLSQLTALEGDKIDTEYKEKMQAIEEYEKILGSHTLLDETIVREMREVSERYADERRTLLAESDGEIDIDGLIPDHDLMVTITQRGYVNAPRATDFRSQGRGGKGVIGQRTKEDDYLCCTSLANARDQLLVFTDHRRVFRTQGYKLPSLRRDATGKNVRTILAIDQVELVRSILPVSSFDEVGDRRCIMATANGIVNMNRLADYGNVHASGINAINADEDDRLVDVAAVDGDGEMILATRFGKTIRFPQEEVRLTKRPSRGVIGIRLDEGDDVIGMAAVPPDITLDKKLLMVTEGGYGKRVSLVDFPSQGRGGKGVLGIKLDRDSGPLVSVGIVSEQDEIIVITGQKVIRILAGDINTYGRYARGVRLMQLDEDDTIFAVVRICS
jgi:DNA gyrase subunit A